LAARQERGVELIGTIDGGAIDRLGDAVQLRV